MGHDKQGLVVYQTMFSQCEIHLSKFVFKTSYKQSIIIEHTEPISAHSRIRTTRVELHDLQISEIEFFEKPVDN